jgi:hypothetical protein
MARSYNVHNSQRAEAPPHEALGWQTPDEAYFDRPASALAETA